MDKLEIEKLYNDLGYTKIDDLYFYGCLLLSGFNKDTAYDLISLLSDLYIKDENNYSIGKLSDMLYNVYRIYNFTFNAMDDLSTRELLLLMYEHEDDYDDEEDY